MEPRITAGAYFSLCHSVGGCRERAVLVKVVVFGGRPRSVFFIAVLKCACMVSVTVILLCIFAMRMCLVGRGVGGLLFCGGSAIECRGDILNPITPIFNTTSDDD